MFSIRDIENYVKTSNGAGKALDAIDKNSPLMSEENYYALGRLMKMEPSKAYAKLRHDAECERFSRMHPGCTKTHCPASLHPDMCPHFNICPFWET